MSDLIALLREARSWLHHGEDNCLNDNAKWEHANMLERIDAALAEHEAEPERKCGTCNYYETGRIGGRICKNLRIVTGENWFCADWQSKGGRMTRARPGYERAVDAFAEEMKAKLRKKAREGKSGWDGWGKAWFFDRLKEHVARGPSQAIDIANFAMMVWHAKKERDAWEAKQS